MAALIKENIDTLSSYYGSNPEENIVITHDFGRKLGYTHCVECPPKDPDVYFKRRGNRPYLSRMVKNRQPQECSKLTMVFKRKSDYMLVISAWIGGTAKPELGDIKSFENAPDYEEAVRESCAFWSTHALIDETIIP